MKSKYYIFDEWTPNQVILAFGMGAFVATLIMVNFIDAVYMCITILLLGWSISFSTKNKKVKQ